MGRIITNLSLAKFDIRTGRRLRIAGPRSPFILTQPSRSWLLGMIEALYIPVSQVPSGTPMVTSRDIDKVAQSMSIQNSGDTSDSTSILRMASPPGNVPFGFPGGAGNTQYAGSDILGQDIGIMIGTDGTAVTPSDRRLYARIGHGRHGADGAPVLQENYNAGDDADQNLTTANVRIAQPFVPAHDYDLTSVFVKVYKDGAPGNITIRIRGSYFVAASFNNKVCSGNFTTDLATGTILEAAIPAASPGAQTECVLASPISLYAGRMYWICMEAPGAAGANHVHWRFDNSLGQNFNPPNMANGQFSQSTFGSSGDAGLTYSNTYANNPSCLFQCMGQSRGEMEIGGCDVGQLAIADPNGSFVIRRRFANHSGGNITIREVGIGICSTFNQMQHPVLAARDVIGGGVAVLDGELLEVTYTPAIVV